MPFDTSLQRKIMGHFATGVTVVTTRAGDTLHGMTANAVTSLSLDPPLVLVCVEQKATMYELLQSSGVFAMCLLAESQQEISNHFATRGPKSFDNYKWFTAETGSPIFEESLAYVDCKVVEVAGGGDHKIFVGEIVAGNLQAVDAPPLLYYAGKYRKLAEM